MAARTAKRKHVTIEAVSASVEMQAAAPPHWRLILNNIRQMRSGRTAAVDTHGCERLCNKDDPPALQRFHILVALMLSSQTKDEVTSAAHRRLQTHGLTVDNILQTPEARIGELISTVGFWRRKARYLIDTCRILKADYGGDIPQTLPGLCALPGVGMKMATIAMAVANKECTGVGVDTHVHRICNRLGWVSTKTAEATQPALEAWLPREQWEEFNLLVVGYGLRLTGVIWGRPTSQNISGFS